MLGAIVGDIVGSRFEFNNHRSKDFELFDPSCFPTDDSIMTLAIAQALMEAVAEFHGAALDASFDERLSELAVKRMRSIGQRYPNCGYGGRFGVWMFESDPQWSSDEDQPDRVLCVQRRAGETLVAGGHESDAQPS